MGISIIIPAHNEEELIGACIDAIKSEIRHIYMPIELLVVCNACTDNTETIAIEHGARVIQQPEKGITWARQAGYLAAQHELLVCIDADNIVPEGWMRKALAPFFEKDIVANSGPLFFAGISWPVRIGSLLFYGVAWVSHRTFGPMLQGGNFVVRKSALQKIGGFSTAIRFYGEDTDLAVRLSKVGRVQYRFDMWINSSSRRLKGEGILITTWKYIISYVWITLWRRPWTNDYKDYR